MLQISKYLLFLLHPKLIELQIHATLLRKMTSLFLLGLIVFIHIVKALHSHVHHSNSPSDSKASRITSVCDICDYSFIREADNDTAFISVDRQMFYPEIGETNISPISFAAVEIVLLRGPPSRL